MEWKAITSGPMQGGEYIVMAKGPITADNLKHIGAQLALVTGWIDRDENPDDDFQCEGCGKGIKPGDRYTTTTDGCYLCEEHAPSFQDVADHWKDRDPATLDEDEREAYDAAPGILAAHIAAGGSPDDKPLTVME